MAVSSGTSFILSSVLTVLLFSGMQMYRQWLASSQLHTILGGYLGSILFILSLTFFSVTPWPELKCTNKYLTFVLAIMHYALAYHTVMANKRRTPATPKESAVGNIESVVFGKTFQTKLFPEVIMCLVISLLASGMVHRVCTTTCLLFSLVALYYINRISQLTYEVPALIRALHTTKKKK